MPSEELAQQALAAVRERADAFRSAIVVTADQLRGMVRRELASVANGTEPSAASLGAFAMGRINVARFAEVLPTEGPGQSDRSETMARALAVLEQIEGRGDEQFRVNVEPGEDLHATVASAFADAGRAFLAARLALGTASPRDQRELDAGFPFRRWSRAERRLAPPLVVEVDGADLLGAGLGSYLDGNACIVLLVSGQAPPAALARLIAAGVLVAQGSDAGTLALVPAFSGPAAIAVIPAEAARFVHRPAAGEIGPVEITHLPAQVARRPVGSVSAAQQEQDLSLLNLLAKRHVVPVSGVAPIPSAPDVVVAEPHSNGKHPASPGVDPVGTLAAWLLSRVDLSDLEGGMG